MAKTTFAAALTALKTIVADDAPDLLEHPDCNAILSHWLHAPDIRPPLLPEKLYAERERIFQILQERLQ